MLMLADTRKGPSNVPRCRPRLRPPSFVPPSLSACSLRTGRFERSREANFHRDPTGLFGRIADHGSVGSACAQGRPEGCRSRRGTRGRPYPPARGLVLAMSEAWRADQDRCRKVVPATYWRSSSSASRSWKATLRLLSVSIS